MKRFLALALAVVFVLGFAVSAYAAHLEVTGNGAGIRLTGEFRIRAVSQSNFDGDSDVSDNDNWYEQRYRMYLDALVADGVEVRTRFTLGDGDWDGTGNTSGINVNTDYAYLVLKKFGGTWYMGLQPVSWGNKLMVWGSKAERIKYVGKIGDVTVGAFLQKNSENHLLPDSDTYSAFAVFSPVEDHKISVIYVLTNNNTTLADDDINIIDVAYNGKAGPVGIEAEFSSQDNDAAADPAVGMFVSGMFDLSDAISLKATFVQLDDGFTADDDFAPTLMIGGAVNPGAKYNQFTAGVGDTAALLAVGAKYKMSDDLSAGANLALVTISDNAEYEITELDLYAAYKLASNTALTAGLVYGMPDAPGLVNDDPFTIASWQIKTTF